MATQTPNGPKPNPGEIKSILKFLKELLPTKVVKAISFLLHPCCTLSGTAVAVCSDVNTFDLTITLSGALPTYPLAYPIYVYTATSGVALGTYTAPGTITASLPFTGGGITNVTEDVNVQLAFPVSTDTLIGVYQNFVIADVAFNGNPCD